MHQETKTYDHFSYQTQDQTNKYQVDIFFNSLYYLGVNCGKSPQPRALQPGTKREANMHQGPKSLSLRHMNTFHPEPQIKQTNIK